MNSHKQLTHPQIKDALKLQEVIINLNMNTINQQQALQASPFNMCPSNPPFMSKKQSSGFLQNNDIPQLKQCESYVSHLKNKKQLEQFIDFMHLKPDHSEESICHFSLTEDYDMNMLDLSEFDRAYPVG